MNWIQQLSETYDECRNQIGYADQGNQRPLLPICHTTNQAQIEIVIDENGNFRRASVITDTSDATTIIPSTESSASRAGSKPENHPLCDKLQYVAGDFTLYGGKVTSGFSKDVEEPFRNYAETLTEWCNSEFTHPKARAVLGYVQKKTVIKDLVEHKILFVGIDRKFSTKADVKREKDAKDIFSVSKSNDQETSFVRWVVEDNSGGETRVWRDKTLWESWAKYYLSSKEDESFCFVTGNFEVITSNHPKYIRWEGDGAKLISANDTNGFTFRGRFLADTEACGIGLETSHKAHFALSWLISRQGYNKDGLAIVAWAKSGAPIPQPMDNPLDILKAGAHEEETRHRNTAQEMAIQLKNRIAGYGKTLGSTEQIIVMAVDSATQGRMAITYYRDLTGSDFLQRIDHWHNSCAWLHCYGTVKDQQSGKTKRNLLFVGAPTPIDIAEAAYGSRIDEKLRKATVSRLLPCIVDGQPIPRDLVESVVRRASNRVGIRNPDDKKYYGDEEYTWKKTLSIACALFRKQKERKEKYEMSLDPNRKTRDYLFGRLLALADSLEEWALDEAGEKRQTNAARLMQRFAERPYSTWRTIELALTPYKARLGGKSKNRQRMIDEVVTSFDPDDFTRDKRLSGEFLLGYHNQREFLRPSRTQEKNSEVE
jgi:CRISPR-associated protein Csd1